MSGLYDRTLFSQPTYEVDDGDDDDEDDGGGDDAHFYQ